MTVGCHAQITKRLNGIDLHARDRGWSLQNESSVQVARSTRRAPVRRRGSHGTMRRQWALPVYDEATARLTWTLTPRPGQPAEDLYAVHDQLVSLLAHPALTYEHVVDGVVRSAGAELETVSEPADHVAGRSMRVSATLALADPFLRGQDADWTLAAGQNTSTLLAGTGPVADALVRFGPGTVDPSVVDAISGTGVSWAGTVPSGQYLYLDPAGWRAWTSSSTTAWAGPAQASATAAMDFPGPGRLQLWPAVTLDHGLYPSALLYPSSALFPEVEGIVRDVVVTASDPCVIRGRTAWL